MLGVSLPLLNVLGGEGYTVLLRQGGFGGVRVQRTPDRPASFVLSLAVPVRSAAAAEPSGAADAAAARLAQSLGALLGSCHADGHLLGAQLVVLDGRTGAPLAELAVGHTSWHAPHAVRADTRFNMAEVRDDGIHAHAHAHMHACRCTCIHLQGEQALCRAGRAAPDPARRHRPRRPRRRRRRDA
jgi:hypothetical protein